MSNLKRYERDNLYPSFFGRYWNNDFFNEFEQNELPAVNVKENDKEFKLEISAPGYKKSDIDVNINKNMLYISGKKELSNENKEENEKILRQEFSSSSFFRSVTLPDDIDTEKIEAIQKDGILHIKLPKMEKAPENLKRKIDIK